MFENSPGNALWNIRNAHQLTNPHALDNIIFLPFCKISKCVTVTGGIKSIFFANCFMMWTVSHKSNDLKTVILSRIWAFMTAPITDSYLSMYVYSYYIHVWYSKTPCMLVFCDNMWFALNPKSNSLDICVLFCYIHGMTTLIFRVVFPVCSTLPR